MLEWDRSLADFGAIQCASRKLQAVPIGQSFALHSVSSGCIVVTNALGIEVLEQIRSAGSASYIVNQLTDVGEFSSADKQAYIKVVFEIIDTWRAAGLFATKAAPFPSPAKEKPDVVASRISFSAPGGRFVVELDSEILSGELKQVLACCDPKQSNAPASEVFRCVADVQGGFALSLNGTPIWSRTDRDEARFLLLKEAAQVLCNPSEVGAVIHGAAVLGSNGRAMLFTAESGSGKSTLSQGLIAQGFGFLADDHIPLSADGKSVFSFPTAAAVKSGAMCLPEIEQLVALHGEPKSARENVTYLSLPAGASLGSKMDIGAVMVPEYTENGEFELQSMSPEEAFSACIVSGARPCRRDPQIRPLASLCSTVPFYKLRYSSSKQSIQACMEIVAT